MMLTFGRKSLNFTVRKSVATSLGSKSSGGVSCQVERPYDFIICMFGVLELGPGIGHTCQLSHSVVSDSAIPWIVARQASLSIANSWSLPKLMSIESAMPSSHLILCRPLLLLPSIFPSIRVFSNESVLLIRWPKYWGFSFSISPSNEHSGLISFMMDWLDLLESKGFSRVFSNTTVQKHQFFSIHVRGAQICVEFVLLIDFSKFHF